MLKKAYKSPWFISAAIAVITLLVFWRVLNADFVMWDDDLFIYSNPTLGGLTLENLRLIFTNVTFSSTWYTPLTGLRWCITYQFCQLNPFGYHLGNLLLHAADAVLVFWVLRKLLILGLFRFVREKPPLINVCAAIGAMLWSLHPMRVEVVNWAANAYGQAMLFLLISLLCYLRANEAKTTRRHWLLLTASLILFAASLLTGPFGIGFLAVLVVLDVYPLGKLGGDNGWWKSANARSALFEKIPFIGVATVVLLINIIVGVRSPVGGHNIVSLAKFGFIARLMQAIYIWAYYIWRPWYPVNLSPVYATLISFDPLSPAFVSSAILVIGIITVLILLRRRWPLGLALGACYFVLLIPVLGILEHPHFPCDRYSLIVSILWSILLAAWLANPKTKALLRNITLVLSIIVIIALGLLTYRQTRIWNNSVSLFEHMIRTLGDDPYSYDSHNRLGIFLTKQGRLDEAIYHCSEAVRIKPDFAEALNSLGAAFSCTGRLDEAINYYKKAIEINPRLEDAHLNLATTLVKKGEFAEAVLHYKIALATKDIPRFHSKFGYALLNLGRFPEAVIEYRKALSAMPNDPNVLNDLGFALANTGEFDETISLYNKALQIAPDLVSIRLNLGFALSSSGRFEEAVQEYEKILLIQPQNAVAHNDIGVALSQQGKFDQAIAHFNRAIQIDSDYAAARDNLNLALSEKQKLQNKDTENEKKVGKP